MHTPATAALGKAARKTLATALTVQLAQDPLLAGPEPLVAGVDRSVNISVRGQAAWATPVQVRYTNLSNSYCRLAISTEDLKQTSVVPVPAAALRDACRKLRQWAVDANGNARASGSMDIVHALQVTSNRGNFEVTEALVYLVAPQEPSGYCYSAQASRELAPEQMKSAAAIGAALAQARARLGVEAFACGK